MVSHTLTRKQREIQEREDLILQTARDMLLERGYLGLTMDRIADAIEYSKGTVYHHFSSKGDVIVALAAKANNTRGELFERAVAFSGRSLERVMGVGIAVDLFGGLYPSWLRAEQIIHASSVSKKAGDDRMRALYMNENRCFQARTGAFQPPHPDFGGLGVISGVSSSSHSSNSMIWPGSISISFGSNRAQTRTSPMPDAW